MSHDLDALSAANYASGKSPFDVAEQWIVTLIAAHGTAQGRARRGLQPLPAWQDLSTEALARKVIGRLLDAGWQPPTDDVVAAAAEETRAHRRLYDEWWSGLRTEDQERVIEHYSRTCEWPDDLRPPTSRPDGAA